MNGNALVVGGGIAGLAVARGLLRGGWEVEVRERSAGPPRTGGALGMWPPAMAALDHLGLGDQVRTRAEERSVMRLARSDGTVMARATVEPTHFVSRSALLDVLVDGVPAHLQRWGDPVTQADLQGHGYDVVVGADGIHSLVRGAAFPGAPGPRPLGTVAFRGSVPGAMESVTETWGSGMLFGITPLDARSTNWFAAVRAELLHGHEGLGHTGTVRDLFADWHPGVRHVLDLLPDNGVDRRRLYDLPPRGSYTHGKHVLIGDAAHAMAPNLGRGACEALRDAVALASALTEQPTLERALTRYDRVRRRPCGRVVRASRMVNGVATTRRYARVRDGALSLAGALLKTRERVLRRP